MLPRLTTQSDAMTASRCGFNCDTLRGIRAADSEGQEAWRKDIHRAVA